MDEISEQIGKKRIPPPIPEKNPVKVRTDPFRAVAAFLRHMVTIFIVALLIIYLVAWLLVPLDAPIGAAFIAIFASALIAVVAGLAFYGD